MVDQLIFTAPSSKPTSEVKKQRSVPLLDTLIHCRLPRELLHTPPRLSPLAHQTWLARNCSRPHSVHPGLISSVPCPVRIYNGRLFDRRAFDKLRLAGCVCTALATLCGPGTQAARAQTTVSLVPRWNADEYICRSVERVLPTFQHR